LQQTVSLIKARNLFEIVRKLSRQYSTVK